MSSIKILFVFSKKCWRWTRKNLVFEDWQLLGNGICIEWRYIDDIKEGLVENGFKEGKDFLIGGSDERDFW